MYDGNFDQDWEESLHHDKTTSRKSGSYRASFSIGTTPVKVHFTAREEPYIHPETGQKLPFRCGYRYYLPFANDGKGGYLEHHPEESVVAAYANPAAFGLDARPIGKFQKAEKKPYYGVSGFVEEYFHVVEKNKRDGSGTFKTRERCDGRGCKECAKDTERVFGLKTYFKFAPKHWRESIHMVQTKLGLTACKCGGSIFVPQYDCRNCGETLVDVCATCDKRGCEGEIGIDPDTNMATCEGCGNTWSAYIGDHKELFEKVSGPIACECGHKGLPVPYRICTTEDCEVQPFGLFDCQLTLRKASEKSTADLVVVDYVIQEVDERHFEKMNQGDPEWAEKIVEANKTPYDLDKLLAPLDSASQAQMLGVADPFTGTGATTGEKQYRKFARGGDNTEAA